MRVPMKLNGRTMVYSRSPASPYAQMTRSSSSLAVAYIQRDFVTGPKIESLSSSRQSVSVPAFPYTSADEYWMRRFLCLMHNLAMARLTSKLSSKTSNGELTYMLGLAYATRSTTRSDFAISRSVARLGVRMSDW